jgi:hypothetical protein
VQPVFAVFSASVSTIQQGQSATLNWQTANASDVAIDNGIGSVAATGARDVSPSATTTYQLTASGGGGTQNRSVTITVAPKAVAAQPAPPAPTPAAPQSVDLSAGIRQAVQSFEAAYNAHDVGRMQAAWTSMKPAQAKAFATFFKGNPTSRVSDNCPSSALTITGDTANWSCNEVSTFESGGRTESHAQDIRFTFAMRNGAWTIVARQ